MKKAGLLEPFAYLVLAEARMPGAAEWVGKHPDEIEALTQGLQPF
jgi:hypothetical protein